MRKAERRVSKGCNPLMIARMEQQITEENENSSSNPGVKFSDATLDYERSPGVRCSFVGSIAGGVGGDSNGAQTNDDHGNSLTFRICTCALVTGTNDEIFVTSVSRCHPVSPGHC